MTGTWYPLTSPPPTLPSGKQLYADSMLLLTDGSVLVHDAAENGYGGADWMRFSPGPDGSYRNGKWEPGGTMKNARQFFASGVRANGTAFVIGGEYSDDTYHDKDGADTPIGEVFDSATGQWSPLHKPVEFDWIRGDIPCCTLADGRVLLGSKDDARTAIWSPADGSWTPTGTAGGAKANTKIGQTAEETWTLMRDGSVLAVETYPLHPGDAEKYVPISDIWVSAGNTRAQLVDSDMHEIGPAVLLPDGRVFVIGGTGRTALYTSPESRPEQPGTWQRGPELKDSKARMLSVNDGPACLLPNGKVLCCAGTRTAVRKNGRVEYWSKNPIFFEYDWQNNHLTSTPSQPKPSPGTTYEIKLLLLPSGEVLCTTEQSQVFIYQPDPSLQDKWRPTIKNAPQKLVVGAKYQIDGTQLNGLSHAVSYGDDYTAPTNYPLVRLENADAANPNTRYCETSEFGYGIATGDRLVSTNFRVPADVTPGAYRLCVVANGIPSKPHKVSVAPAVVA